jgi:ATP-dependent RNA helicase DeaD
VTLVEPREQFQLRNIERITRQKIAIAQVPTVADVRARRLEVTQASLREALLADDKEHFRVVVDALSAEFDPVQIAMAAVQLYHQATAAAAMEDDESPSSAGKPASSFDAKRKPGPAPYGLGADMAKIFIGAGRQAGVRPQDLVGAIANEAGVAGGLIGAIQISDRFSVVEVPGELAAQVIKALGKTTLRGKKVQVRRDKSD